MRSLRPLEFIRAAGALGGTSVALSVVLFVVSMVEHKRDKSVPAYWFICLAPLFFAIGAYLAWSAERDKLEEERAKNQKPLLKIEMRAAFFEVSPVQGTQRLQVHIITYLRVTNLSEPRTLIKCGTLTMVVGGVEHLGTGDDGSVSGGWVEHNSAFRLGGEMKAIVFGEIYTPVRRLIHDINWEYPLVQGVHRDGIVVFNFQGEMDWDRENPYTMDATHLRLSLTDSFDQQHSVSIEKFDIPNGNLRGERAISDSLPM
jgi:hypothetical protein